MASGALGSGAPTHTARAGTATKRFPPLRIPATPSMSPLGAASGTSSTFAASFWATSCPGSPLAPGSSVHIEYVTCTVSPGSTASVPAGSPTATSWAMTDGEADTDEAMQRAMVTARASACGRAAREVGGGEENPSSQHRGALGATFFSLAAGGGGVRGLASQSP